MRAVRYESRKNSVSEPYYKNDLVGNMSFKDVFHP